MAPSPTVTRWPLLFSPFQLGPLRLPNRLIMSAMDPSLADAEGHVDDRTVQHYALRAAGGAGLLVTGHLACDPGGRASPWQPLISDDRFLPGLRAVADAVHDAGGRVLFQVSHAGRQSTEAACGGQPISASPLPCPLMRVTPRELTSAEVDTLADRFVEAALRARRAGADGVEFHMAHGYLVCQFLSPYSNLRQDEWGGSEAGRARLALEIVRRSRAALGPDYPIQCRISADERVEGGITPPLALVYARWLVEAGATSISVSACNYESFRYNMPAFYLPRATYAHLARTIRQGLGERAVPVVAVGRFSRGAEAEAALAAGDADLIAMGRALIADPRLPDLLRQGRDDAVRPCVACNRCAEAIGRGPLRCTVNPAAGRLVSAPPQVADPKDVLVVGGGPAGITAACEAASRGHRVRLLEASHRLGGNVWSCGLPPRKEDFHTLASWLVSRLRRAPVSVHLGEPLGPEDVLASDAEIILVAVGAVGAPPPAIPGLARHEAVLHPVAAMEDPTPRRHVLIIGAGAEGAEVADAMRARPEHPQVSLVELRRKVGLGLPSSVRLLLEERLALGGVGLYTRRSVARIATDHVQLADRRGRPKECLPAADLVVVATGLRQPPEWAASTDPRVTLLGDCLKPASLLEAIAEGWRVGKDL